jgi:uncharacterized membrane protein YfcA
MAVLLGFLIAIAIGATGVGGGILTTPVLIAFFGVPPVEAVTISLLFAAAVKFLIAPAYLWRRQVDFPTLWRMLAGGVPGVLIGSLLLRVTALRHPGGLSIALGAIVAGTAALNLYRLWFRSPAGSAKSDRSRWLPAIALPIGAEVGFSSAGAGAIGTVALMSLTRLSMQQVVATDVCFGLILSLAGGGVHWSYAHSLPPILWPLLAGGAVGAITGVYAAGLVPARPLRTAVCLWLIGIGMHLCWKGIGM